MLASMSAFDLTLTEANSPLTEPPLLSLSREESHMPSTRIGFCAMLSMKSGSDQCSGQCPASCTSWFSSGPWDKPLACYKQALQSSTSFIMMMAGLALQEADQIKGVAQDLASGRSQVCAWHVNTWGNAYIRVCRLKIVRPLVVKIVTIVDFKKHHGIFFACVYMCVHAHVCVHA
jgi:hypothetical protein